MTSTYALGIVFSAVDNLTGPVRTMQRALGGLEELAQTSQSMVQWGQGVALTGGLVNAAASRMRAPLTSLVDPIIAIEEAVIPLRSVVISTVGDVDLSIQEAVDAAALWSSRYNDSMESFLATYGRMSAARLVDKDALDATYVSMMLATAAMGDQAQTADTLANLYSHLGDTQRPVAEEMMRIADMLTVTKQLFGIQDFEELAASIAPTTMAAREAGMELSELITVLGQLNTEGFGGGQAGNILAGILRNLVPASRTLGFEIQRANDGSLDLLGTLDNIRAVYGTTWHDDLLFEFQRAFGYEGAQAISLLLPKVEALRDSLGLVQDSAGATAVAHEEMSQRVGNALGVAQNNIKLLRADIGESLVPVIEVGSEAVVVLVSHLRSFVTAHPHLTRTIVMLLAIAIGIMSIIGPILVLIGTFSLFGGRGIQAIMGVGRGLNWLINILSGGTIPSFSVLVSLLRSGALGVAGMIKQFFTLAASALPPAIAGAWSFTAALLANPITWVVLAIIGLIAVIVLLVRHWDTVSAAVSNAWNIVVGAVKQGVQWVTDIVSGMIDWLFGLPGRMYQAGLDLWNGFTEGLKSVINKPVELVQGAVNKIKSWLPWTSSTDDATETIENATLELPTAGVEAPMAYAPPSVPEYSPPPLPTVDPLPEVAGTAVYSIQMGEAPAVGDLTGIVNYEAILGDLPAIPGLTGTVGYDMQPLELLQLEDLVGTAEYQVYMEQTPDLPELTGIAGYDMQPLEVLSLEELIGTAEYQVFMGEPPELPELTGIAGYDVASLQVPTLEELLGTAEYQVFMGQTPELPELSGSAGYDMEPLDLVTLDNLVGTAEYEVLMGSAPDLPLLTSAVGYDMPAAPSMVVPVEFDVPDLELPEPPELVSRIRYEVEKPDLSETGGQVVVTSAARTGERREAPPITINIYEAKDARHTAELVRQALEEILVEGANA